LALKKATELYGHFTSISKQKAVSKVHIKALVCFHVENRKPYDFLSWKAIVDGKHLTVILAVLSPLIILTGQVAGLEERLSYRTWGKAAFQNSYIYTDNDPS